MFIKSNNSESQICNSPIYGDLWAKTQLRCVKSGSLEQSSSWSSEGQTGDNRKGMIEVIERKWTLIRVSHTALVHSPWHDIIWWKLSPLMEETVQSTSDSKNGRLRHMSGPRQAHTHTYIFIYIHKDKNNTNRRTGFFTIRQSKRIILSQQWHKPKSTWLKLDLSNSTQAISVSSEGFSTDGQHGVTLLTVTVSLRQVSVAIHWAADIHTLIAEKGFD